MLPCTTASCHTCPACLIGAEGSTEQKTIYFLVARCDSERVHQILEYVSQVYDNQKERGHGVRRIQDT